MPPRSTNAPKSAMFLTTPLRSWPTSSCLSSSAFFSARSASIRLRRLTTMLRRASSILSTRHSIVFADVVADVVRPADIDLAGRQEHVDADVDQQAALDLAGDLAGDDVALVDGLHDLHPLFDLLGLALAEDDHAAIVLPARSTSSTSSTRTRMTCRRSRAGRVALFPFVAGDDAFALVADVDEDEVVVDAKDFAFDDLIGVDVAAARASPCPRAAQSPMATFQSSSETSNSRIKLRLTMQKKTCVGRSKAERPEKRERRGQGANRAPPEKLEVIPTAEQANAAALKKLWGNLK